MTLRQRHALRRYIKPSLGGLCALFLAYLFVGARLQDDTWLDFAWRSFLFALGTTILVAALVFYYKEWWFPATQRHAISHPNLIPLRSIGLAPNDDGQRLMGYVNGYYTQVFWHDNHQITHKGHALRIEMYFREDIRDRTDLTATIPVEMRLGYLTHDLECGFRKMPSSEQIMYSLDQLLVTLAANRLTGMPQEEWSQIWPPEQEKYRQEALAKSVKKSYRFLGLKIDIVKQPKSGAA
jgi:hypothetical protein